MFGARPRLTRQKAVTGAGKVRHRARDNAPKREENAPARPSNVPAFLRKSARTPQGRTASGSDSASSGSPQERSGSLSKGSSSDSGRSAKGLVHNTMRMDAICPYPAWKASSFLSGSESSSDSSTESDGSGSESGLAAQDGPLYVGEFWPAMLKDAQTAPAGAARRGAYKQSRTRTAEQTDSSGKDLSTADSSPQASQDTKARAKKNFEALALRERQSRPNSPRSVRVSFGRLYDEKSSGKSETVRLVEQVDALLKFLGTRLSSEGLHRKAAPEAILKAWCKASEKGTYIPAFSGLNDEEHAASTKLKQLFAENYRGDRLIPTNLQKEVAKLDDKTDMDQHAKLFMKALPAPNRALFSKILDHLVDVSKNSGKNLMTVDALATVYGPKLIDHAGLDVMSYACKQPTAASLMKALINLHMSP